MISFILKKVFLIGIIYILQPMSLCKSTQHFEADYEKLFKQKISEEISSVSNSIDPELKKDSKFKFFSTTDDPKLLIKFNKLDDYQKGVLYFIHENYKDALEFFGKAAGSIHVNAQIMLGHTYLTLLTVKETTQEDINKKRKSAFELFDDAVDEDDKCTLALVGLIMCYQKGYGVSQNNQKAAEYITLLKGLEN